MANERDTHFVGFAKLLFDDLYPMFSNLLIEESDGDPRALEAEKTRQDIKEVLAESAYDLVRHALEQASHGEHAFDAEIVFHRKVTDLTAWPNTSSEAP